MKNVLKEREQTTGERQVSVQAELARRACGLPAGIGDFRAGEIDLLSQAERQDREAFSAQVDNAALRRRTEAQDFVQQKLRSRNVVEASAAAQKKQQEKKETLVVLEPVLEKALAGPPLQMVGVHPTRAPRGWNQGIEF